MRPAQIALTSYFVRELQFSENQAFDAQKISTIEIDDLQLTHEAKSKTEDRRSWELTLRIAVGAAPERNLPCSFLIEIIGLVRVDQSVKEENIERLIGINGISLVFSVAREIVRAVTSRGQFRPILLPTVTFWEPKPAPLAGTEDKIRGNETPKVGSSAVAK
jgi:preprotein translocase subunit SecB